MIHSSDTPSTAVSVGGGVPPALAAERPAVSRSGAADAEIEALVQVCRDLEARLRTGKRDLGPESGFDGRRALDRLRGVPDKPEDYCITCHHPLLEPDPDVNARLHRCGFTGEQAQLVYDLALEKVIPVLEQMAESFEAECQKTRLVQHFGGEDRWHEIQRQVMAWGRANLSADVLETLSRTAEGVIALHRMMTSPEPGLGRSGGAGVAASEDDIRSLMRDPRYWRDRDPALVRRVSEGFRRLYPG
ncbi:hypothetical protein HEQ60_03405 [Haematospirillum sp. H1815]|uniref:capsid assembly protein n=1 Tax=Haematospirillum sp. H1815 TaxID=2723108 RepID=UPI00143BBFEF|nr:hypothetical protein [Haematospirillum sp. H1815]NKD76815.1 hypothetical protein [Haematospirillum sp. H1815]